MSRTRKHGRKPARMLSSQLVLELLDKRESPTDMLNAGPWAAVSAQALAGHEWNPTEESGSVEAANYGKRRVDEEDVIGQGRGDLGRLPRLRERDDEQHGGRDAHRSRVFDVSALAGESSMPHEHRPWHVFALPFDEDADKSRGQDGGGGGEGKPSKAPFLGADGGGDGGGRRGGGGSDGGADGGQGSDGRGSRFDRAIKREMAEASQAGASASVQPTLAQLAEQPMQFELNVGQSDGEVEFLSRGLGYTLFVTPDQAVLTLLRPDDGAPPTEPSAANTQITMDVLALSFVGANAEASVVGADELANRTNYFKGGEEFVNIPNYQSVTVHDLYAGIDVRYYGSKQGLLEYDLIVRPGADLADIKLSAQGAESITLDESGNLVLQTAGGEVTMKAPLLYQETEDGLVEVVDGNFVLNADNTVGFTATGFDSSRTLVIDPVLEYSSFLSGSATEYGYGIAVDGQGNSYLTGYTTSSNFPTLNPYQSTMSGSGDIFVTKFNATGTGLIYSTYLGGTAGGSPAELASAIAVDAAGHAYVTGQTSSTNFPTTTGAYQTSYPTGATGPVPFVTKLNATGDGLLYSTYVAPVWSTYPTPPGPSGTYAAYGIAVNAYGEAYITGTTGILFPTTAGVLQTAHGGGTQDAFVTKLAADGTSLLYSTYLGGSGSDTGQGIAVDDADNAYVTGQTVSTNFPTTAGVYQTTNAGSTDAFVTKINPTGTTKVFSSYLGGASGDIGYGIAVDLSGYAYITGSASSGFPTTGGAYDTTHGGSTDAYITKLNTTGTALSYSSFVGATGADLARGITVSATGEASITGTAGASFPTVNPLSGVPAATGSDVFVTRLVGAGSSAVFSTTVGPGDGRAIAGDINGDVYITGQTTYSTVPMAVNYPTTTGAYQTAGSNATFDAFVSKISTATPPPVITSISTDSGSSSTDEITTDQTLSITGTSPNSATVKLYRGGIYLGQTTANGSGAWTYDYTGTTLAEGSYAFTATATVSSIVSKSSAVYMVNVDRTAPTVTATIAASTTSYRPKVEVFAIDQFGLPASATVTIDLDRNNDADFLDANESAQATGTMTNGYAAILVPIDAVATNQVRARVTDLAGNEGNSANKSSTVTTVTSPWTLTGAVRIADPGEGLATEQTGNLSLAHPLDFDKSPGAGQGGSPYLVYNSSSTNVKPVVHVTVQADNAVALPSTFTATLTWNGGAAQTPVVFSTTGYNKGDALTLGVQVATAVATTGRYSWSMRVQGSGGTFDQTITGVTYVRVEDASPYGAGWTMSNQNTLVPFIADANGPAGQLWLYGTGGWRFFEGASGTFTSPPEDNGVLSGNFSYLAAEGWTITFDGNGKQTAWTSADGKETTAYTYTGTKLTGFTAVDGAVVTLTYANASNTLLSSIATPGSRTWSFLHTGTDLTTITDADARTHTFGYGTSGIVHKMTSDLRGDLQNAYGYNTTTGLLTTVRWGNTNSPTTSTLNAVWSQGLSTLVVGEPIATWTDALGYVTATQLDSKGRVLVNREANGGVSTYTRDAAGRVTVFTDPINRVTSYARDSMGYVTTLTFADGNDQEFTYLGGRPHFLKSFKDELNNPTTYVYSSNRLASVTNALNETTTYTYNSTTGLLTSITDPLVHLTSFTYDSARRLESTTDPFGGTVTQTYDTTSGEVATFVDQLVRTTTYLRDTMGRVTTITHADTFNERFVYNTAGMLAYHYDKMGVPDSPFYDTFGRGLVTAYSEGSAMRMTMSSFDVAGRATGSRDGRGFWTYFTLDGVGNATGTTDAKGNTTASAFDLASQMLTSRDQMGNWTDFTYNQRGWMTTTTDPLNNLWTTTFNAVGNVTSTDDPLGHGGATTYDVLNRVSTSTDARGYVTTQTYWADGRAKDTTDPLGIAMRSDLDFTNKKYTTTNAYGIGAAVTTESNFDLAGQTTSSKDGLGHFTTYTKNSVGDTTAVTDALNHTMTYTVDKEGRTTKITDALGKFTTLTVDLLGRQVKTFDAALGGNTTILDPNNNVVLGIDGMANQTKNIYDQLGNLVLTVDALQGLTRREYDALSRLVAYTDASGNKTLYEYNELSQLTKVTDPNAGTMTFVYDAAGRETSRTDQLSRLKEFTYLDNNLLSTEVWKSGGSTVNTLTFTYSATSQLLTAADTNGTISFTYDDLSRQRSVTDVWGITLTNSYDAADRLTSVADELGGLREYTWDNADRMTVEKYSDASAQLRVDFTYSNRDQVTQIDRYTDTAGTSLKSQTVYGLDDEGKALTITHKNSGGTTVDSFTYTYDLADRIMTETSTLGATKTYTYDRTSQVTGDGTTSYSWDANGNRNNAGYTTTTGNRLSTDGTYNFTYDAAGNETKKVKISNDETWVYAYDHNNRLIHAEKRATQNGASIESIDFKYDIFGNRIERDYDSDGAGAAAAVVLKMAYENGNAWADLDNSLALTMRRVYTGGLDSLVARIDSTNNEDWYLTDVIGSVRDLVNSSGTLIDHIDYGSFGNITAETQPTASDRYKFTSREFEKEADIQYNRARYLQYGRWMSQDPLGFGAGDSNLYRYVSNNPITLVDPNGMQQRGRELGVEEMCLLAVFHKKTFGLTSKEFRDITVYTRFEPRPGLKDIIVNQALRKADAVTFPIRLNPTLASIYWNRIPSAFKDNTITDIAGAALIGHELVHVVQMMQMGGQEFLNDYMGQFLRNTGKGMPDAYEKISYERYAYAYQRSLAEVLKVKGNKARFEAVCDKYGSVFLREQIVAKVIVIGVNDGPNAEKDALKFLSKFFGEFDADPNVKALRGVFHIELEQQLRVEYATELAAAKQVHDIATVLDILIPELIKKAVGWK